MCIKCINAQTTVRGPCKPHNFLIRAGKVNIGIQEPMFHLILHNTEPLSCINWFLMHDTPSAAKPSVRARKWLVSISNHRFERKGDINLQYHTFQEAFTRIWMEHLFMEICCVQVLGNYLPWNFDAMTGIPVFHRILWNWLWCTVIGSTF